MMKVLFSIRHKNIAKELVPIFAKVLENNLNFLLIIENFFETLISLYAIQNNVKLLVYNKI